MITLEALLRELPSAQVSGPVGRPITAIAYHSASVRPGALFVAIRGQRHDGHTFVAEAMTRGAPAVVVEHPVDTGPDTTQVVVSDTRLALALLSAAFFGHPSRQLTLIGITGTNGKGTTAYLLEAALSRAGQRAGVIGTLGVKLGTQLTPLERTTPEAPDLQRILRQMADSGIRVVVMEVASHALTLHRVVGCYFRGAVFTNLTQDHLDFHHTLEAYRAAKRTLFQMVAPDGVAVINADDPSASVMAAASRASVITYGLLPRADVRADDVQLHLDGADFTAVTPRGRHAMHLRLPGRFNVSNALAAIAAAQHQGVPLDVIAPAFAEFAGVPGRFEAVQEGQPFGVIVDYAHTPDGLENVLRAARDFVRGRLVVVFGCGGDRDRTKRPIMGRIAAQLADVAVVTSDNPRSEDPAAIIEDILRGTAEHAAIPGGPRDARRVRIEVEPDRRKAITRTLQAAQPGDVVIIAGKGHEPYQEIKGVKHPFDDRVVAREVLRMLPASNPSPRVGRDR
jgi:UDP-N-acetylmuramoyl-L-alanyl-D-glutamate--2,6-diaminopimelate ligase